MCELTVSSGMRSGHVYGIPEDDVLCFWPEVLMASPEITRGSWHPEPSLAQSVMSPTLQGAR